MEKQQTFDTIVTHLRKQGARSSGLIPFGGYGAGKECCLYRGPDGRMCAAGVLIPDAAYSVRMEGRNISDPDIAAAIEEAGHDLNLVDRMQGVHDFYGPGEWEHEFQRVASPQSLTYTPPSP